MLNQFGHVADLFRAVGVKAMPVSQADTVASDRSFVTDAVRSCEDPVRSDEGTTAEELRVIVTSEQAYLPGPRSVRRICAPDNTALRNCRPTTFTWNVRSSR